ncbi:MAG: site-specific integrase, partial [Pseudomonadota bacterium]
MSKHFIDLWKHPKHGTYYALWREGGKPVRKALCPKGTKRATKHKPTAERLILHFRREFMAGRIETPLQKKATPQQKKAAPQTKTLAAFTTEFIKFKEGRRVAPSTVRLYRDALNYAKRIFIAIDMGDITPKSIESFQTDLGRTDLATATVNKLYRHFKAAVKQSIVWGYTPPIVKFPTMLNEADKIRYFEKDELGRLFMAITDQEFLDLCDLAVNTGLRNGECLRLTVADIDRPEGYLHISEQQKNRKGSTIPINTRARQVLNRRLEAMGIRSALAAKEKENAELHIFKWQRESSVSNKFKAAVRKAKLSEAFRFHDLRHTFASWHIMSGTGPKAVQELMRHKSFKST